MTLNKVKQLNTEISQCMTTISWGIMLVEQPYIHYVFCPDNVHAGCAHKRQVQFQYKITVSLQCIFIRFLYVFHSSFFWGKPQIQLNVWIPQNEIQTQWYGTIFPEVLSFVFFIFLHPAFLVGKPPIQLNVCTKAVHCAIFGGTSAGRFYLNKLENKCTILSNIVKITLDKSKSRIL